MLNHIKTYLRKKSVTFFIGMVVIFFLLGIIFGSYTPKPFSLTADNKKNCLSNLHFINPEPDCEIYENKLEKLTSLQETLNNSVNAYVESGRADRISVFTRDLSSLRYVGVNESDTFFMASLLKVPLSVAYMRLSEITPDLLDQRITYTGTPDLYRNQAIEPLEKLTIGKEYTIKELIFRALSYSDNTAAEILSQNYVSSEYLQKILLALGLQVKKDDETEDTVTAKSYAGVFRTLYNSSLLSRTTSDEILKILSKSTFTDGATADLPKNIIVSHKFGERVVVNNSNVIVKRQLHDCGIVYAKNASEPYSFCIMTEGKDFSDLKSVIQNISSAIYKELVD